MSPSEAMPRRKFEPIPRERLAPHEITALDKYITEYLAEGPRVSDFEGTRPEMKLKKDAAEVERLRNIFATNESRNETNERYAHALEMVLLDFSSSWLPGYISKASEYDDYINKTDLVLEAQDENDRVLRIALDVTSNPEKVRTKVQDIVADLRKGWLSRLKYFVSQLDNSRTEHFVPRVVIGSNDPDQVVQLIKLYLNYREAKDIIPKNAYRRAISEHPIGRDLSAQVLYELQRTVGILKSADAPQDDLDEKVSMIEATIAELERFNKEKAAPVHSSGTQSRNTVLSMIFKMFASA